MGQAQIVPHYVDGLAERFGGLLRRHPSEVAHFNELGQGPVLARERLQGGIQIQQPKCLPASRFDLPADKGVVGKLAVPMLPKLDAARPHAVSLD